MRKLTVLLALGFCAVFTYAQNQKVSFNGTARSSITNNWLTETDTSNADQSLTGNSIIDLRMDIKPSENIRVKTDLRFQNPMGGFWGQGAVIQVRHLSLKGVAGKVVKYRFGDIDLEMTPYTLYNNDGDLSQNESEIFKINRNIMEEDNYNFGHNWHQQGTDIAFRLGFDKLIQAADFHGFMVRNRSVEGNLIPDKLHGGASTKLNFTPKSFVRFNYINLFDVPTTVNDTMHDKNRNFVYSTNANFDIKYAYIFGEAGISKLQVDTNKIVNAIDKTGEFFEIGIGKKFMKNQLKCEASYRRVSDDFISAGAQSKRLNYYTTPSTIPTIGNDYTRPVGLLDLYSDQTIYNPIITYTYQGSRFAYNPVLFYGKATPNRKGVNLAMAYDDSAKRYNSNINFELLQNVRGEGTEDLKNFMLLNWNGTIAFDKIFKLEKTLQLNAGIQYGTSKRDGHDIVPDVDLVSTAIDAGIIIEIFNRFDVLGGIKTINAKGTDYSNTIDLYNQITDYQIADIDANEILYGYGVRYRFNDNVFLTVQGKNYTLEVPTSSYSINQLNLLFNLKF